MDFELADISNIDLPLVSVIITAFNRAHTIVRAVDSVLRQTYKKIELLVIDDGSTDNTLEVLKVYTDPRIKIYRHESNKGVTAAKNSGLDHITGQWFTILDSDDEMKQEAIEAMIKVPLLIDPTITAVTCNCWDAGINDSSGKGLLKDQYIDVATLMTVCKGIFWGITRTDLLLNDRFNEKLNGFESTLWYKINDRAKRYYIHQYLNILHTEGDDRITKSNKKYNHKREINTYENIINEEYYLNITKKYQPIKYYKTCKTGMIVMRANKNKDLALKYYNLLRAYKKNIAINLMYKYRLFSLIGFRYIRFKFFLKQHFSVL